MPLRLEWSGLPLQPFYAHQVQAITEAKAGQSFGVTRSAESGEPLCLFVPIVDAAIKARKAAYPPNRTRAISLSDERASPTGTSGKLKSSLAKFRGRNRRNNLLSARDDD